MGKLVQNTGANSQPIQAQTVIVGIDEKRAREIIDEKLRIALNTFSIEANTIANKRSKKFNNSLIRRMVQENALKAFSDPSFQILLIEAQKRAASAEREQDYDLLSELMVHRFQKGSDRTVRAGISRAVEIVDQISNEALLAITVFHSVSYFRPVSGNMNQGLEALDDLFNKVIYDTLPTDNKWFDHLDILDAMRTSSFGGTKLLEDYWYELFDGYLRNGIEKESKKYNEVKEILIKVGLDQNCLVKNILNEKYVKLAIVNKDSISRLSITDISGKRPLTGSERSALEKVYDLYDSNKVSKEDFIKEIEKYPNLKKLREWWNKLKEQNIRITSVGRVLAHSNAQRIDKNLPPLD